MISKAQLFSVAVVLCVVLSGWFWHNNTPPVSSIDADIGKDTADLTLDVTDDVAEHGEAPVTPANDEPALANDISFDSAQQSVQVECEDIQQQINSHPAAEEFRQFNQSLSSELIDSYYEQLNMDELLAEAQTANVSAMRMLSEKYLRYAQFQSYSEPDKNLFDERLKDRSALAQSRYWNEQAGLHGYVGAFFGFAFTYSIEISELTQQLNESPELESELAVQIRDLEYQLAAHMQLAFDVMPQLTDILLPLEMKIKHWQAGGASGLPFEPQEYEQRYQDLYAQWQYKRAQLGLPPQFEFSLTPGVRQLMALEKQLYNCYR